MSSTGDHTAGIATMTGPGTTASASQRPERMRWITVLGHPIRVSVRPGTGSGPPLLLCNGIGASLDLLEPFVDALPADIEVISFDAPGVGGSPMPRIPYNFAMLAALVGRLLDRLGHRTVDVLGMSWGGGLAQQFAFQNPRRCRRLVLVSTATGVLMVPGRPDVLVKMMTPRRYRDPEYARSIAGHIYGGVMRARPELAARLMAGERLGPSGGYLLQLLAGAGWTSLPFLPLIKQPTLVLAGADDPIIPVVNAKIMTAMLPKAQLHIFPDGHLGIVTMSGELGPRVGSFLRSR